MSLLLEALKKAERAKQEQENPSSDKADSIQLSPFEEKGLSPLDAPTKPNDPMSVMEEKIEAMRESIAENKPVLEFIPDEKFEPKISETEVIEITDRPTRVAPPPVVESKPIPKPERQKPKTEFALKKEESKPESVTVPEAGQRHAAQTLFDAKQPKKKSSSVLLIAGVGVLVAALIGGYYYWVLFYQPNASFQSVGMTAPPLPIRPQNNAVEPVNTSTGVINTNEPAKTELPKSNDTPSATAEVKPLLENSTISNIVEKPVAAVLPPAINLPQVEMNNGIKISRTQPMYTVSPNLTAAYQAYTVGDIKTADNHYHRVLHAEPNNRDALLGLAAIALYRDQPNTAETLYLKLLELDPKDAAAQAGLINLQGQADPIASESRIKSLLTQQPNAGALNFALGNLYANQNRWAEAQQVYFRAYSSEPDNPDYLYNLAISLDHLNQSKLALEYYQRALAIANKRPIGFDKAYLLTRIKELSS